MVTAVLQSIVVVTSKWSASTLNGVMLSTITLKGFKSRLQHQRQQRQQQQHVQQQAQQQAQWRSSSTPIECTASGSLTVQWQASTADRLFKALQTMFTTVPARGVKRAVLQDWNCADSPSLKRFRFEGESYAAAQGSNPEPADFERGRRGPARHSASSASRRVCYSHA